MADILFDRLATLSGGPDAVQSQGGRPQANALEYLTHLSSQRLSDLEDTEPRSLQQTSHSLLLSLQALSKKSHKAVIDSTAHHASLTQSLPAVAQSTAELRKAIGRLDSEVVRFSTAYSKFGDSDTLTRRKRAQLLANNVERIVDVMELPALLASTAPAPATASAVPSQASSTSSSLQSSNYGSALELSNHVRRLHALYPGSALVASVAAQADDAMRAMVAGLVVQLRIPTLKLAAALRTVSWLRRLMADPELQLSSDAAHGHAHGHVHGHGRNATTAVSPASVERDLEALFLVCRLTALTNMLDALEPLRDLADQETARQKTIGASNAWSDGKQTERYLKKYIEIFREQSFAIVSMFRSVFPQGQSGGSGQHGKESEQDEDLLRPRGSAMSTFVLHLADMLVDTLRCYLPNVREQATRDSLLTQVLYCAGSLGRLGGDFSGLLACVSLGAGGDGASADEWAEVVRRHRMLAGRLESIVGAKST